MASTPVVKEWVSGSSDTDSTNTTVATSSGVDVGDLIVCIHGNEWGSKAGMLAPTGTDAADWAFVVEGIRTGTSHAHIKLWTRIAETAGVQTVTVNTNGGANTTVAVAVIDKDSINASDFLDGYAGGGSQSTQVTAHVHPSVTPVGPDDLLICASMAASDGATDYTAPTGMTKVAEEDGASGYGTLGVFTQTLGAAGATGTRTATSSIARRYDSVTLAIKGVEPPPPDPDLLSEVVLTFDVDAGPLDELTGAVVTGGNLEISAINTGGAAYNYHAAKSSTLSHTFDSIIIGPILEVPGPGVDYDSAAQLNVWSRSESAPGSTRVGMEYRPDWGKLCCYNAVGYYDATAAPDIGGVNCFDWDPVEHAYWRITVDPGGWVNWDVSPDGETWTELRWANVPWAENDDHTFSIEAYRRDGASDYFVVGGVNVIEGPVLPPLSWAADLSVTPLSAMGFENWQRQNDAGTFFNESTLTPPVVSDIGGRPGLALEHTIASDFRRDEVVPNHRGITEGDSAYFAQAFYLPVGFGLDPTPGNDGFQIIDQIHQAWGSFSPPIAFEALEGQLRLTGGYGLSTAADPGADPTLYQHQQSLAPLTTGRWYDLVYFVDNFSETAGASTLTVWLDGVEVLSEWTVPPPTLVQGDAPGIESYRKTGIYQSTALSGGTIYIAGIAAGQSYAEVDPHVDEIPALEGSGELTILVNGSGQGSKTAARAGEAGSIAVDGSGAGRKFPATGLGSAEINADGSGAGSGTHVGSGSLNVSVDGSGLGKIAQVGILDIEVDGSGEGTGEHVGSGSVDVRVDGSGYPTAAHYGTGTGALTPSEDLTPGELLRPSDGDNVLKVDGDAKHSAAHVGTGDPHTSVVETGGDGRAFMQSAAGITRPVVGLTPRLIDEDGLPGVFLPDWTTIGYTERLNQIGTIAIEYAKTGVNADLLKVDRTEGALFDGAVEMAGTRFIVTQSQTDAVKEDESGNTIQINAPMLVPTRLAEATVFPTYGTDGAAENIQYNAVTPGYVIGHLLEKAKHRGACEEIHQGWSSTHDTVGRAWQNVVTMEVEPGGSIMSVIDKLVDMGVLDWDCHGRELRLWEPALHGQDRTIIDLPLILQKGRDILDAPEKREAGEYVNAVLVVGKEGKSVEVKDQNAIDRDGRIEGYVSVNNVEDLGTLTAIGHATIKKNALPNVSYTHGLALFDINGPQPWVDYYVGDWLGRDLADGNGFDKYRVAQLSISFEKSGNVTGAITLGTLFETTAQKLQAKIDALTNGSTSASTAPAPPVGADSMPPATPVGLLVHSDAYTDPNKGGTFAAVRAVWGRVTKNQDGSPINDFSHYELRWRRAGGSVGDDFDADLAEAACEALWHHRFGNQIFEDFTFPGCSQNLRNHNQTLVDLFVLTGHQFEPEYFDPFLEAVWQGNLTLVPDGWNVISIDGNQMNATWSPVPAGKLIAVQVRGVDRNGNTSQWSTEVTHVTAADDIPPPIPTQPIVTNYLGVLKAYWDGQGYDENDNLVPMSDDFQIVDVHVSPTTSAFEPTEDTLYDSLAGAGTSVIADLDYETTYYVRLVARDFSDNASEPSEAGQGIPEKLVNIDLGPDAVQRLQIKDGEIVSAKIGEAQVNDAHIANLSVGKLTAGTINAAVVVGDRITTALTGQRVEFSSTGIRKYDSDGILSVDISDDDTYFRGSITTGLPGESRIVIGDVPGTGHDRDSIQIYDIDNFITMAFGTLYGGDPRVPAASGLLVRDNAFTGGNANTQLTVLGSVEGTGNYPGMLMRVNSTTRLRFQSGTDDLIQGYTALGNRQFAMGTNVMLLDTAANWLNDTGRVHIRGNSSYMFAGWGRPNEASGGLYVDATVGVVQLRHTGSVAICTPTGAFQDLSVRKLFAVDPVISGREYKHDIDDLHLGTSAREFLEPLRPVQFKWNDDLPMAEGNPGLRAGFIADEVAEIPLTGASDQGIDLTSIVAIMRLRQTEQDAEYDALLSRIEALESRS